MASQQKSPHRSVSSVALRPDDDHAMHYADYNESMTRGGFRFTLQRREVYDALLAQRDHPTATDVFLRVKERLPNISLATVYSCLETLAQAGLIRHVNVERGPARFCPNLEAHGHFFCTECHSVLDIKMPAADKLARHWQLPEGLVLTHHEVTLRGLCPDCATQTSSTGRSKS